MENNELFHIGEVAKLFHISISLLRHYDKIGLVKPEYTDPQTGYRYYSVRQFECLNTIRYLRALDMPLEQISEFLRNRDTDLIHDLLIRQKEEVRHRQEELRIIERKIDNRLSQIEDALSSQSDVISVVKKPELRLASIRKTVSPRNYLDLEFSIRQLEHTETNPVTFLGKVGIGIFPENLLKHRFQPYDLVFLLLDEEDHFQGSTTRIPEGTCVTIRFQGGHDRASGYYEKLIRHIDRQGYEITGFSREITMIDYGLTNDTSKFVTEIQIPVSLS